MPRSLIALGSNLGDRTANLRRAVERISAHPLISGLSVSRFHETRPIGGPANQDTYLNAAAAFDTSLAPEKLHDLLHRVESEIGRRRAQRWDARVIDLDLLLHGDAVIATETLSVPHPRMAFRRFVLEPAVEVAGQMVHPLVGWSLQRLLSHLDTSVAYVALLGMPDAGQSVLAQRVADATGGTYLAISHDTTSSAGTVDPSGLAERGSIQFLDRAAAVLASRDWQTSRDVAISDFYVDELLAYARVGLNESEYRRFEERCAARRQTVVAPRLLVVLDAWEDSLRAVATATSTGAPPEARLRHELLKLAARADQGPVLFVGRDNPQFQFDELTAAIAAAT